MTTTAAQDRLLALAADSDSPVKIDARATKTARELANAGLITLTSGYEKVAKGQKVVYYISRATQ